MRKVISLMLMIMVISFLSTACGKNSDNKLQSEPEKQAEVATQKQTREDQKQNESLSPEKESGGIIADDDIKGIVSETNEPETTEHVFPYGIDKLEPIFCGFGNIIAVNRLDDKDYTYDPYRDYWSVIGASLVKSLVSGYGMDFGRGSYIPNR